ncbi:MAG: NADH-quinone oxidoreductase subunit I [Fibrobacteria bacterium]|nr:NADH-quinone oxidoreductase subunit I [Fibrobacteria bacterium]
MTLAEKAYIPEILRGMRVTWSHFLKGFNEPETLPVQSYPEVQWEIDRNYRAKHRLMKRPDGEPRCVACFMCSTACPARCIHIEATESDDPRIEKKPAKFDIDLLVCVFCGLCAEACPVDAIRMDTKVIALAADTRGKFVATKEQLLDWNPADYPASDTQSQKAPGGLLNAEARARWAQGDAT